MLGFLNSSNNAKKHVPKNFQFPAQLENKLLFGKFSPLTSFCFFCFCHREITIAEVNIKFHDTSDPSITSLLSHFWKKFSFVITISYYDKSALKNKITSVFSILHSFEARFWGYRSVFRLESICAGNTLTFLYLVGKIIPTTQPTPLAIIKLILNGVFRG